MRLSTAQSPRWLVRVLLFAALLLGPSPRTRAENAMTEGDGEKRAKIPTIRAVELHGEIAIVARGLPALAADGKRVAYVSSRGGYGESTVTLRIVAPDGRQGDVELEDVDTNAEPDVRDTAAYRRAAKIRASKANALLRAGKFTPLTPATTQMARSPASPAAKEVLAAGSWLLSYDTASSTLHVFDRAMRPVLERPMSLDRDSTCCAADAKYGEGRCEVACKTLAAWGNERVVFLLGDNLDGPDGCEVDSLYVAIWPKQRISHAARH